MRETLEMRVQSLGQEDPLEEVWQPTPIFLPGESPRTEEPGGLLSIGSQSRKGLKRLSMHRGVQKQGNTMSQDRVKGYRAEVS